MRPSAVQVGDKFGRLTVLKYAGLQKSGTQNYAHFWCRCSCGKKISIRGASLTNGNTQSCGCQLDAYRKAMKGIPKSERNPGEKFGRLTVVRWHHTCGKSAIFEFKCDCGLTVQRAIQMVRSGKISSCGCLLQETARKMGRKWSFRTGHTCPTRIAAGEAAFKTIFSGYKNDARKRNYAFTLTFPVFKQLAQSNCHYCGQSPATLGRNKTFTCLYNGVDRVDNTVGYTVENSVTCCHTCNTAKHTRSKTDFLAWARRIAHFHPAVCEDYAI